MKIFKWTGVANTSIQTNRAVKKHFVNVGGKNAYDAVVMAITQINFYACRSSVQCKAIETSLAKSVDLMRNTYVLANVYVGLMGNVNVFV